VGAPPGPFRGLKGPLGLWGDSTSAASGAALFPASQQGQGSVLRLSCSKAAKDARTSTPTQKKTKIDKSEPHPSKSAGGHKMQFSNLSDEQLHHYQVCQIHAARCSSFYECGVFYVAKTTPHRPPQLTHTKHTLVHTHKKPTHRPCVRIHAHIYSHAKTHTHAHTRKGHMYHRHVLLCVSVGNYAHAVSFVLKTCIGQTFLSVYEVVNSAHL